MNPLKYFNSFPMKSRESEFFIQQSLVNEQFINKEHSFNIACFNGLYVLKNCLAKISKTFDYPIHQKFSDSTCFFFTASEFGEKNVIAKKKMLGGSFAHNTGPFRLTLQYFYF